MRRALQAGMLLLVTLLGPAPVTAHDVDVTSVARVFLDEIVRRAAGRTA